MKTLHGWEQGLVLLVLPFTFKIHFIFLQSECVAVPSCLSWGERHPFSDIMNRCFGASTSYWWWSSCPTVLHYFWRLPYSHSLLQCPFSSSGLVVLQCEGTWAIAIWFNSHVELIQSLRIDIIFNTSMVFHKAPLLRFQISRYQTDWIRTCIFLS